MLDGKEAMATIAVRDVEAAGSFYEGVLGLQRLPTGETGVRSYSSGRSRLLVYESHYAGTNQATNVTWPVEDVDAIVRALAAKGVVFEHYEFPGMTLEGDVHVAGDLRVAWFKDPDGNIHSIVSR